MSQCLEYFVIIRGPGIHHQAEASSGMLIPPPQPKHCLCAYRRGAILREGARMQGGGGNQESLTNHSESGGCGPSAADPTASEALNREPPPEGWGMFMCVTCIPTRVQACTFTHSRDSTVKYLQSAHMWMCLRVSPCAWEIRSHAWNCLPERLWAHWVLLSDYICGRGAR